MGVKLTVQNNAESRSEIRRRINFQIQFSLDEVGCEVGVDFEWRKTWWRKRHWMPGKEDPCIFHTFFTLVSHHVSFFFHTFFTLLSQQFSHFFHTQPNQYPLFFHPFFHTFFTPGFHTIFTTTFLRRELNFHQGKSSKEEWSGNGNSHKIRSALKSARTWIQHYQQ